ncbi:uncharacterized protein LOC141630100 [Silene latifolia]|uniref:uncharacterized protein LOC141630100 n=1 Tax=Silene latifolia TaxID=37657 RepID=UPI003D770552
MNRVMKNVRKKKRIEELTLSKKGALDKFIIKEVENNIAVNLNENENIDNIDGTTLPDEINSEHSEPVDKLHGDVDNVSVVPSESAEQDVNNIDQVNSDENFNVNFEGDIFDPWNWDKLDAKSLDDLAVKGPKRDLSIENGPKDR